MSIRISAKQVPKLLRDTDRNLRRNVRKHAIRAAQRGRNHLRKRTPVDQGQLKNSWRVHPGTGSTLAVLENDAPHAGIVELGARPHGVNEEGREALRGWVRRTLGIRDAKEIESAVWGIVKKIGEEGQKPTFFVRDSMGRLTRIMAKEMAVATRRAAAQSAKGVK